MVNAYRRRLDGSAPAELCERELDCASHREYFPGFYFGHASMEPSESRGYISDCQFIAIVLGERDGKYLIEQRNNLDKRSAELRTLERNKGQEREKLSAEIVRLDERKIAMRKEYDELNDMLFEQYELTRREAEALNIQIENMKLRLL